MASYSSIETAVVRALPECSDTDGACWVTSSGNEDGGIIVYSVRLLGPRTHRHS